MLAANLLLETGASIFCLYRKDTETQKADTFTLPVAFYIFDNQMIDRSKKIRSQGANKRRQVVVLAQI